MNHRELRQECEPSLRELLDERSRAEARQAPEENYYPIDFDLIQRVLRNERKRELEKQWNGQAGLRAKRLNSSLNGKKVNRARIADCITDISK